MKYVTWIGAVAFMLWGLLHVIGGASILFALLEGPANGYSVYQNHDGNYTALSGAILGYFAFLLLCIGGAVFITGLKYNWHNSQTGLAVNTALAGITDVGLVIFLLLPGFVTMVEASLGLLLLVIGAIAGGIACNSRPSKQKR